MADNKFTVNSIGSMTKFISMVPEIFEKGLYVTFSWSAGKPSSMPQKALIHIWIRKYAAHLLHKPEADLTKAELAGMKRAIKTNYYNETHESFMVEEIHDPWHPDKKRMELTSIADYQVGECFKIMEWIQQTASGDGLILESIGEHKKLKRETTA
jgi:hypothetical protein